VEEIDMIVLPRKEEELVSAVKVLEENGQRMMRYRKSEWLFTRAYLNGFRDIAVNQSSGAIRLSVSKTFLDPDLRVEHLLRGLQIELGRFLGVDVRPAVSPRGWGLDRLRMSAVAQVVLDALANESVLAQIRPALLEDMLLYGCVGLASWVEEAGVFSSRTELEVIPPWQLLPIPWNARHPNIVDGLIRTRIVPLEALLRNSIVGDSASRKKDKLNIRRIEWGESDSEPVSPMDEMSSSTATSEAEATTEWWGRSGGKKDFREAVRLTEVWLRSQEGLVNRYIVRCGDAVLIDEDYERKNVRIYLPIGIARYYPVGFYGRGFLSPVLGLAMYEEEALRTLVERLKNEDDLGMLLIPTNLGVTDRSFRMTTKPRRMYYQRDAFDPAAEIGVVSPHSTGNMPIGVVDMLESLIVKSMGQSELYQGQAAGRADSAAAFGFLLETGNVGIEAPGNSLAGCFTTVYSAMLSAAHKRIIGVEAAKMVDLDRVPVGVVLNEDGELDLTRNPIPDPSDVIVNIRSRVPPSKSQVTAMLMEQLRMGIIDPFKYRIEVYRRGLDIPVGGEGEFGAWRKVRMVIRTLYNDGVTPNLRFGKGLIDPDPEADDLKVAISEITDFMKGPEFALASVEVKRAFYMLKKAYEAAAGMGLPPGMPPLEQIMQMGPQAQEEIGGAGPVPGGTPPAPQLPVT